MCGERVSKIVQKAITRFIKPGDIVGESNVPTRQEDPDQKPLGTNQTSNYCSYFDRSAQYRLKWGPYSARWG